MCRLFSLALILLWGIAALPAQVVDPSWQRISGHGVGYSLEFPADGWYARLIATRGNVPEFVTVEQTELTSTSGARISVDVWEDQSNGSLADWIDDHQKILGFKSSEMTPASASELHVGAFEHAENTQGIQAYPSRSTFFKHGKDVFGIRYHEADNGAAEPIYGHLLETLTFERDALMALQQEDSVAGKGRSPILVYECAGHYDDCLCGAYNPYPCCSNPQGNCTWWAWDRACCVWNDNLLGGVSWGNATSWAGYATSHGYTVSATPAVNTIACNSSAAGGLGHVAWVVQVSGSQVQVTEMGWCLWGTVRTTWYNTSYFDQGFIYPMGGGSSITLTSPNGGENLCVNQQTTVQWQSSGIPGNVRLRLYQGSTNEVDALGWIGTNLPNTGSYPWIPGTDLTTNCNYYVKVEDQAQTTRDFSNAAFCISDLTEWALSVSATDNNCNNIAITWNDVSNETGYKVYRNGGQIATLGIDVTNYTDTPGSGCYLYTVRAYNTCGDGPLSSSDQGCRLGTPAQVSGVTATDNNCNNVVVTWTDQSGENGYYVYRNGSQIGSAGANVTIYTDNTASQGVTCSYAVAATNTCGTGSQSVSDNGTRLATPVQVAGVAATDNNCNNVVVTWTDQSGEQGYRVYRNGSQIGTTGVDVCTYTDAPAVGTYTYSVGAYNACGDGTLSATDPGTRLTTVGQVTGVSATDDHCADIVITWTDRSGENGYYVYRGGSQIAQTGANVTTYTDAPSAGTYNYTIAAFNDCGTGTPSAIDGGARLSAPVPVSNVIASDNICTGITVTWWDVSGESGYYIYRNGSQIGDVSANTTTFNDAPPSGTYAYTVRSYNGCGTSTDSNLDNGTRLPAVSAPSTCAASDNSCQSVTVTWIDNSTGETGFHIFRDGSLAGSAGANAQTFDDTPPSGSYLYTVRAYSGCGDSYPSNSDQGTRLAGLLAPLNCVASDTGCSGVNVSWTDNVTGETGFYVYRGASLAGTVGASVTSFYDTPASGAYAYTVCAYNACGSSNASNSDTGTRLQSAAAPSNCQASDTNCSAIIITWQDNSDNENGFRIFRNGSQVGSVGANVTFFYNFPAPGVYNYSVCAYTTACGNSVLTPPVAGQRQILPAAPLSMAASDTGTAGVYLSWQDTLNNETGFAIYRDAVLVFVAGANVSNYYDHPGDHAPHNYCIAARNSCGEGTQVCDVGRVAAGLSAPTALILRCESPWLWLYWNVVRDDQGNPMEGVMYNVYRGDTPGFTPSEATLRGSTSDTLYVDTPDAANEKAFYTIIAQTP
jgi:surface antigen